MESVLLLHNRYRLAGGEERSVQAIAGLLRSRGHRVELLERSSELLSGARGRARAATAMLRGGVAPGDVAEAVRRSGADVVHAHNIGPLFGPRALQAARGAGARIVMHLHNYRLVCSIAITYRDGGVCTRCHGRNTLPGVRHRCRGSLAESAVYAAGLALHQPQVLECVDRFVAPSHAAVSRLGELGLPTERIDVLHNFLPATEMAQESAAGDGKYALYAGRLVEEKGVDTAVEAAARAGVPLVVAGDGPDLPRLRRLAEGANVRFAGRLDPAELVGIRRGAAFAVVPSRWDEPCPYAAIEAMAGGLPVLASAVGGLPEMVGDHDATVPAGSIEHWVPAMETLWLDPDRRQRRGEAALDHARELFGEERFYSGLMDVYARAGTPGR